MSIIAEINLNNNNKIIRLVKGDIREREVDAIVNAANPYLRHVGGVAAAIVRKGGAIIQQESNKIGFVPVGFAAITTAGKLPCKAIIHAVGPRMGSEVCELILTRFCSSKERIKLPQNCKIIGFRNNLVKILILHISTYKLV
jgi:hypothetical protein